MSRILAISDIHGHSEGAAKLLQKANYVPGVDRLYLLGDFIDWDPGTWAALGYVRALVGQGARAVLGNMERWLLAEADKEAGANDGTGARMDGRLSVRQEDVAFLRETPLYWREGKHLFVHAGVRPGVALERQTAGDLTGIRREFWGDEAALPYTVVFGHTPTFKLGAEPGELWFGRDRIGIDTGAKHGFRLTLVDLTNQLSYSCSTSAAERYADFRTAEWSAGRRKQG